MEVRQKTPILSYDRKEEFWISGKEPCSYADLLFPIGDLEFHIKGDLLEVSLGRGREGSSPPNIWLNRQGIGVEEKEYRLQKGDVLSFASPFGQYDIMFFEKRLDVTGDFRQCHIRLPQTSAQAEYFSGFPYYKRSPRIIYRIKEEKIEVKAPPKKKAFSKGGVLQMIIPTLSTMAFTILMGVVLKRGAYVYMSVGMTIITLIFSIKNFFTQRKEIKEENKLREEIYTDYLLRTRKRIRKAKAKEKEAMEYQNPPPQELAEMLCHYNSRLYERTLLDDDFLQVNLGYYSGKSKVSVTFGRDELDLEKDELTETAREIPKEYGEVDGIPVTVDLKRAHLGLVGSKHNIHEQLKYLLLQLTFFQSYHDLQVIFIHHERYRENFSYMRWYPHLKIHAINVSGEICNEQARDQILGSIQQMLKDRKQKLEEERQETIFTPHLLFIIDEPKLVLNHAIMEYLQSRENPLGFSIIYTTDQRANLPENIQTICVLNNAEDGKLLLEEGERKNRPFALCSTRQIDLEAMARSLSAIVHEQGVSSKIPESITFFEMYQIEHPQELSVAKRWKKNQSHKSLAVPLGVRAEEDYVELNLHEKAHGPHGLVAGTTGSGKSEIVQSYILSLAVNFHPHEVGFLLIDYKGGGMANLFEKLPHLLGTITNLDKAESMRAMASIKSELSRRQQIFSDHGVNHINGYNKLFKLGKVEEPLPHLFLISDEFAELKKEQPEFMSELVSAARIGRSLGIHLILATQKPSGVVDDQIWTNSKFKLCLKVQNAGDSKEMLRTSDAANITQAGRAYLQVGNNEIYELFQSAWSGATYGGEQTQEEKEDDRVYLVNALGQGELINEDLSGPTESNQIKATQLDVIVEHIQEVYEQEQAVEVKKPWLPSLPNPLESPHTKEVQDSAVFTQADYTLGIGMIDVPEEQLQEEYRLDLLKNGHLLYMASSGYGKSIFLAGIVLGLSMKNAVKNLNFYILDLGNSALIALRGLPHVADYMGLDDTEKIGKFQKRILEEMAQRKRKFAKAMAQNILVYNESQEDTLKAIVIIVDNYDVIKELGDAAEAFVQKVARDGASLGVYLVVTMTRTGAMKNATQNAFKEKIAGFHFEESEVRSFVGRSEHSLPEDKKGRALVKRDGINMMQIYTPVSCDSEVAYNANLKELIGEVAAASTEERAPAIPTLPEELYYKDLPQYPEYRNTLTAIPVGLDIETLQVRYLHTEEEPGLIIGGVGTGRTNALWNAIEHVKEQEEGEIYVFDNEKQELAKSREQQGVRYGAAIEAYEEMLEDIRQENDRRKEQYKKAKEADVYLTPREFYTKQKPVIILIDVVQKLWECLTEHGVPEKIEILADAIESGMHVIATSEEALRASKNTLFQRLSKVRNGIALGNIKGQNIFPYAGIREENHDPALGYYHDLQGNHKMKMIQHI